MLSQPTHRIRKTSGLAKRRPTAVSASRAPSAPSTDPERFRGDLAEGSVGALRFFALLADGCAVCHDPAYTIAPAELACPIPGLTIFSASADCAPAVSPGTSATGCPISRGSTAQSTALFTHGPETIIVASFHIAITALGGPRFTFRLGGYARALAAYLQATIAA